MLFCLFVPVAPSSAPPHVFSPGFSWPEPYPTEPNHPLRLRAGAQALEERELIARLRKVSRTLPQADLAVAAPRQSQLGRREAPCKVVVETGIDWVSRDVLGVWDAEGMAEGEQEALHA